MAVARVPLRMSRMIRSTEPSSRKSKGPPSTSQSASAASSHMYQLRDRDRKPLSRTTIQDVNANRVGDKIPEMKGRTDLERCENREDRTLIEARASNLESVEGHDQPGKKRGLSDAESQAVFEAAKVAERNFF